MAELDELTSSELIEKATELRRVVEGEDIPAMLAISVLCELVTALATHVASQNRRIHNLEAQHP